MATNKAIKDPGIKWSSDPYGTMPAMSAGNVGGYASAPTNWGFLPQLAAQLGYQAPQVNTDSMGYDASYGLNQQAVDQAAQWLQGQGLTPVSGGMGSTYYNGVKDASGNLVGLQGLDSAKAARGDLMGLLGTVGLPALGGAYLSGSLGGLGGAGSSSLESLLGPQGLDAINGMAPAYTSGALPSATDFLGNALDLGGGLTGAETLGAGATLGGAGYLAPAALALPAAAAALPAADATTPALTGSSLAGAETLGPGADLAASYSVPELAAAGAGGLGLGSLASGAVGALGGAKGVGALVGGLLGAAAGPQSDKSTVTKTLDPRMDAMLYGPGGYLQSVQDYFNANKNGNPNMQAGASALQGLYTNPAISQGYANMANAGQQMMAGNGGSSFLQGLLSAGPRQMPATVPYTNIAAPVSIGGGAPLPWMKFGG